MNDQEYLEKAGIDSETGGPIQETPTSNVAPVEQSQQSKTPMETFELQGNKYPVNTEFNILHNGNPQKVPYSNLINTYRQAAHLHDKWGAAQKQLEGYKDYDKYKGFHDKYGQLQEWSEKNPKDWESLYNIWQNKDKHLLQSQLGAPTQQGQTPEGQQFNMQPLVEKISTLEQMLQKYDGMYNELQQQKAAEAEEKDISFIKNEIGEFTKEFSEIDVNEKDPDGLPLWAKIVQWGNSNGYREFTPAAHMFLKQRIAETYSSRARAEAMKTAKDQKAQGIVKRSATPFNQGQGQNVKQNIKGLSYSDLARQAKDEIQGMAG